MANTKSAKKNVRKNEKRRLKNLTRKSAMKSAVKKIELLLKSEADLAQIEELLKDVSAKLARAKNKKVIHPNTAARKMSRLAKKVNAKKKEVSKKEV
jgi:small subunit ribosomal protein S20